MWSQIIQNLNGVSVLEKIFENMILLMSQKRCHQGTNFISLEIWSKTQNGDQNQIYTPLLDCK